jgi:hypothetical protein
MLERIEAPIDRRRGSLAGPLLLNKRGHVAPGDGTRLLGYQRKKQAQISPVVIDGVGRIIAPLQIGTELGNGVGCHQLVSSESMALRNGRHGQVVLLPFGGLIELSIAQGLGQRMMAKQFFEDFQGHPRVEEVRGKCMPEAVGRIMGGEARRSQVLVHQPIDL